MIKKLIFISFFILSGTVSASTAQISVNPLTCDFGQISEQPRDMESSIEGGNVLPVLQDDSNSDEDDEYGDDVLTLCQRAIGCCYCCFPIEQHVEAFNRLQQFVFPPREDMQ